MNLIFMGDSLPPWKLIQLYQNPRKLNFSLSVQAEQAHQQEASILRSPCVRMGSSELMPLAGHRLWEMVSLWTVFSQFFKLSPMDL